MFHWIATSSELGCEKPDPKFFAYILKQSGVAREELLHVGDSLEKDYYGAIDAGLQAFYLARDAREQTQGVHWISSLADLVPRLEGQR